ncbi:MAG: hypothetical protein IT558_03185 [Alphaproteobacteria bacterium]|nr:hypothetical protein [Alphaproteobacteria bacterium]
MRFMLPIMIVLALAGCRSITDPDFMPSGYTYHNQYYKAPPGPSADDIGYAYTKERNAAAIEQWEYIVAHLVGRMDMELGEGPQPIYIETLPRHNAFNASFDYALREELRSRGYTLTHSRANALHLRYEAFRPGEDNAALDLNFRRGQEPDTHTQYYKDESKFSVALILMQGKFPKGEVRSMVSMSDYGYVPGEGLDPEHKNPKPEITDIKKAPPVAAAVPEQSETVEDTGSMNPDGPQSLLPPPIEQEPLE